MSFSEIRLKAAAEFELRRRKKTFREWLEMMTPEFTWSPRHLVYAQEYLQRIADGESLKIMFLEPARHGKSEQNTIRFAAYYLYKNPTKKIILGAYNQEFANDFSVLSRQLYRQCMPNERTKNTQKIWYTSKGGYYKAAGLRGGVTGKGGDLILIDDPVKDAEVAYSKQQRDKMWRSYRMDFRTRLEPGGSIILTMTPWHHDGLVNRILNSDDAHNWIVVKMPALAGKNDLLGRKPGDALWPERWSREQLLEIKAAIGDDEFNALYQVSPVVLTGNIVQRDWFILDSIEEQKKWPIKFDFIGQYWDAAVKRGESNDYYCCVTIGVYNRKKYLLNVFREKMTYPQFKDEFIKLSTTYMPDAIKVEDKANGSPIIQEFADNHDIPVKPEAVEPKGDKEYRLRAITAELRNEGIHLQSDAYWIDDFIDEVCLFPQSPHDDQVDAFSMGMNDLKASGYNLYALIGR